MTAALHRFPYSAVIDAGPYTIVIVGAAAGIHDAYLAAVAGCDRLGQELRFFTLEIGPRVVPDTSATTIVEWLGDTRIVARSGPPYCGEIGADVNGFVDGIVELLSVRRWPAGTSG